MASARDGSIAIAVPILTAIVVASLIAVVVAGAHAALRRRGRTRRDGPEPRSDLRLLTIAALGAALIGGLTLGLARGVVRGAVAPVALDGLVLLLVVIVCALAAPAAGRRRLRTRREREVVERLRGLDDLKGALLVAVSHQLRTPLTVILGIAQTLQRQEFDEESAVRRDLLARLEANARRLDVLLTDLLDLDRLQRGVIQARRQETNVAAVVRRVVETVDMDEHPVHLDLEEVTALVDPGQVERILENLLANVRRHTPPRTPAFVHVHADDGVLIRVEDAGPGLPDAVKGIAFEAFRHGDVRSPAPGTGIGLALVARFAALHGGRAWVTDRPGGGACFHVHLPGDRGSGLEILPGDLQPEALPRSRRARV